MAPRRTPRDGGAAAPTGDPRASSTSDLDQLVEERLREASSQLEAASEELGAALARASEARDALDALEGLVDELLSAVPSPLIVLDVDLRVVGWSVGAEERWSRPPDQAVGRKWSRIKRMVDDAVTTSQLDELLSDGGDGHPASLGGLRVRALKADGRVHYLLLSPEEP